MSVRRSGFATDWAQKPGDAVAGLKLSLPRTQTRGDRWRSGLHSPRMEDAAKLTKNLCAQCTLIRLHDEDSCRLFSLDTVKTTRVLFSGFGIHIQRI